MNSNTSDTAIDRIIASCNGDLRGAVKALMLVNEQLEDELQRLYAIVSPGASVKAASALH